MKPYYDHKEITICPFCKEKDFDLIGLKHHIKCGHCDVFESLEEVDQLGRVFTRKSGGKAGQ